MASQQGDDAAGARHLEFRSLLLVTHGGRIRHSLRPQQLDLCVAELPVEGSLLAGSIAALVAGRVTSCYGSRSGAMHDGVDIAAPIGTPIHGPASRVVLDAGPANGFGLAVYIQDADGTITVYGHINHYFMNAGQQVAAGQQIAEVGNRGQSTGPHLHIETHRGGLYQGPRQSGAVAKSPRDHAWWRLWLSGDRLGGRGGVKVNADLGQGPWLREPAGADARCVYGVTV